MNGRAIPGAEMNMFRLTNVIPEQIIFLAEVSLYHCISQQGEVLNLQHPEIRS